MYFTKKVGRALVANPSATEYDYRISFEREQIRDLRLEDLRDLHYAIGCLLTEFDAQQKARYIEVVERLLRSGK